MTHEKAYSLSIPKPVLSVSQSSSYLVLLPVNIHDGRVRQQHIVRNNVGLGGRVPGPAQEVEQD